MMAIARVGRSEISFKRLYTPNEEMEHNNLVKSIKSRLSHDGKSILIINDSCLPQNPSSDIGIGHLTSKTSSDFFDFVKSTVGVNVIEVLPPGEIQIKHTKGFFNNYNGSALSLGMQQIDLELLTEPKFNSILPMAEFEKVVAENKKTQIEGLANFENVLLENSPQNKALRVAFENFRKNSSIDKLAFEAYKKENMDWLEPKAVYSALKEKVYGGKDWTLWDNNVDKNLYDDIASEENKLRLAEIKSEYADDVEFYKFKQFIAEEHLKLGKKSLNDKGMKLFGDCLIGYSPDEVWANKTAFMSNVYVGKPEWKIPSLNFENIMDENSAAQKLLRRKVGLFAKRYDGIRMDCSWVYVKPKLSNGADYNFDGSLLDIIEDSVRAVNKDFDMKNLIHEFEADPEDFSIFSSKGVVKPFLSKRVKIFSSAYMSEDYGSASFFKSISLPEDDFIIGVGNHDHQPLRQIANDVPEIIDGKRIYKKSAQRKALVSALNLQPHELTNPVDFAKAKFAEPLIAKNNMVFYVDLFGKAERFDSQQYNTWKNYRLRMPYAFKKTYFEAIQEGYGYNYVDAGIKALKVKGLNSAEDNDLIKRSSKLINILKDKQEIAVSSVKKGKFFNNKIMSGVGVVFALGLIATIVSAVNKGLKEQAQSNKKI